MARVQFTAYKIHEITTYFSDVTKREEKLISIALSLRDGHPFPAETIEASRLADVRTAFEAYVTKAAASGKQLQLHARVIEGRSPAGFNGARLRRDVNV